MAVYRGCNNKSLGLLIIEIALILCFKNGFCKFRFCVVVVAAAIAYLPLVKGFIILTAIFTKALHTPTTMIIVNVSSHSNSIPHRVIAPSYTTDG